MADHRASSHLLLVAMLVCGRGSVAVLARDEGMAAWLNNPLLVACIFCCCSAQANPARPTLSCPGLPCRTRRHVSVDDWTNTYQSAETRNDAGEPHVEQSLHLRRLPQVCDILPRLSGRHGVHQRVAADRGPELLTETSHQAKPRSRRYTH